MSIGTSIVIVGAMFFLLAATALGFVFFQFRKLDRERDASIKDFEQHRKSIEQGARRSSHRFSLRDEDEA